MTTKFLEIRDRITTIPAFAMDTNGENEAQSKLLSRAGFSRHGSHCILFGFLQGRKCEYDPYNWGDRTLKTAHLYIEENFTNLNDGDIVDVEFILGETDKPKESDCYAG